MKEITGLIMLDQGNAYHQGLVAPDIQHYDPVATMNRYKIPFILQNAPG